MKSLEDRLKQAQTPDININSHRELLKQRLATPSPTHNRALYKHPLIIVALLAVISISGISAIRPDWTQDIISSAKLVFEKQIKNDDGTTTVVRAYQCTTSGCCIGDSGSIVESIAPNGDRVKCRVLTVSADANNDPGIEKLLSGKGFNVSTAEEPNQMKIEVTDSGVVMNGKLIVGTLPGSEGEVIAAKMLKCASGLGMESQDKTQQTETQTVPALFTLEQNFPNPFNPETTVRYSLKTASEVSLKVYSIEGKEVATLANGYHEAGNYSVNFSGKDLPTGPYICRMTAGNYTDSKKMTLLK